MAETFLATITEYSDKIFAQFFARFIVAVVILLIGFIIGKLLGRLTYKVLHEIELNKIMKKANINLKLEDLLSNFITYFIYFITVIWALNEIGLTTTILNMISAAALFIIIVSILLAIKDFIPNVIAGITIHQKEIFKEGQKIRMDDLEGRVNKISILETIIETKKGDAIHIPNSNIIKKEIIVRKR